MPYFNALKMVNGSCCSESPALSRPSVLEYRLSVNRLANGYPIGLDTGKIKYNRTVELVTGTGDCKSPATGLQNHSYFSPPHSVVPSGFADLGVLWQDFCNLLYRYNLVTGKDCP